MVYNLVLKFQRFLENLDSYRDKFLFIFIKPYWPRAITPNHVSWVRAFVSLILFVLIFFYKVHDKNLIITLFIFGVFTDLIDGPIARGLNKVTEFGAMLDSTTDRLLLLPIAIYSLVRDYTQLLYLLLFMELLNLLVAVFYQSREIYLESNIFGKTKMFLMCIVFVVVLYVWPNPPPFLFILMLWLTIPFTLLSIFTRVKEIMLKKHAKTQS